MSFKDFVSKFSTSFLQSMQTDLAKTVEALRHEVALQEEKLNSVRAELASREQPEPKNSLAEPRTSFNGASRTPMK